MFGERIKALREKHGLTQKQLSEKLNINYNTLASYERENREPPFDVLISLARYFDASVDYVLGLSEFQNQRIEHQYSNELNRKEYQQIVFAIHDLIEMLPEQKQAEMLDSLTTAFALVSMFAENIEHANNSDSYLQTDPDGILNLVYVLTGLSDSPFSYRDIGQIHVHQNQIDGCLEQIQRFINLLTLWRFDTSRLYHVAR